MRTLKNGLILLSMATGLTAGTITVISQGATPGDYSQPMNGPGGFAGFVQAGWTTGSNSYSNVTITVVLDGQDPGGDLVDAYLDTASGPGTTAGADEVASHLGISVPYGALDVDENFSTVTVFTGLSLNANTSYYLTLAPEGSDQIYWGVDNGQPGPTVDDGVVEIGASFCSDDIAGCADYPPASPFVGLGANPIFTVTSNPASVPEPASWGLLAAGLAFTGLLHRCRWR